MNANNIYLNKIKLVIAMALCIIGIVGLVILTNNFVKAHNANGGDDADPEVDITLSLNGNNIEAKLSTNSVHRFRSYATAVIVTKGDGKVDCDEDVSFSNSVTALGNTYNKVPTTDTGLDKGEVANPDSDADTDHGICFKVTLRGTGDLGSNPNDYDHIVYQLENIDLDAPKVKKDGVTISSGTYDYSNIGDKLVMTVMFDEEVMVFDAQEAKDTLPTLTINKVIFTLKGDGDTNVGDIIAKGTSLMFERTLAYNDGYVTFDEDAAIALGVASGSVTFEDMLGNMITENDLQAQITAEKDFGDVTIDMTPMVSVVRKSSALMVQANPSKYAATGDDKDDDTVTPWMGYVANSKPDDCFINAVGSDDDDDDYIESLGMLTDNEIELDEDPDNKWYCFKGTLSPDGVTSAWQSSEMDDPGYNMVATEPYQYVADTQAPSFVDIAISEDKKTVVIKANDDSGIKSVAYRSLDSQNTPCSTADYFNNELDFDRNDNNNVVEATITIRADLDGRWICVNIVDNVDKENTRKFQIQYTATEDDEEEDGEDGPTVVNPPVDEEEDDDMADDDEATNVVVIPVGFESLPLADKLNLNPYQCIVDTRGTEDTSDDVIHMNPDGTCQDGSPSALPVGTEVIMDDGTTAVVEEVVDPSEPTTTEGSDTQDPPTVEPTQPTSSGVSVNVSYDSDNDEFNINVENEAELILLQYVFFDNDTSSCGESLFFSAGNPLSYPADATVNAPDDGQSICVSALDNDSAKYDSATQEDSSPANEEGSTGTTEEEEENNDEEGSNSTLWIIIAVVVVIVLVAIILVANNKKNNQI